MIYKRFGNSSCMISSIGQGLRIIENIDTNQDYKYVHALELGIKLGMTFIDTAEIYGNGYSECLIARVIKDIRNKVFISTKVSPENLSYDNVIQSAEMSLNRLHTDYIDLYQIHWPNPKIPIKETMQAMERLVDEGKIRYIGVCNFSLKELMSAEKSLYDSSISSIQVEYNLFDRTIENTILPYCEQKDITVIAYGPLDQGRIVNSNSKNMNILKTMANKYNRTVAQIVLNWLIYHRMVVTIPRSINTIHIEENSSSTDFNLSEKDFVVLSDKFIPEVVYVDTNRIRVASDQNHLVYQTIDDAMENKLKFVPSPVDLAQDILRGEILKPIRIKKSKDIRYDYDLIEGRIRYWAWTIAHNGKKPIPTYIRDN